MNRLGYRIEFLRIMNNLIRNITIENLKINGEKFFSIGYCTDIEEYLLCVHISWVAGYDRYYKMDEGDFELYEVEQEKFCEKYEKEIKAYRTEKLIAAGALRDYDFRYLPDKILKNLNKYPPFEGYNYKDGSLYARVKIGDNIYNIPPIRDEKRM